MTKKYNSLAEAAAAAITAKPRRTRKAKAETNPAQTDLFAAPVAVESVAHKIAMGYFKDCQTLNDLKSTYKRLAQENHPDKGGNARKMAEINNEYRAKAEELANGKTTNESESFLQAVSALMKYTDLYIELCGAWLWVSGNTKEHKDELKATGLRYAPKKKMWYWKPAEDTRRYRGKTSIGQIRDKYGSIKISGDDNTAA